MLLLTNAGVGKLSSAIPHNRGRRAVARFVFAAAAAAANDCANVVRAPAHHMFEFFARFCVGAAKSEQLGLQASENGDAGADDDAVAFKSPAVPDAADAFEVEAVGEEGSEHGFPDFVVGELDGVVEVGVEFGEFVSQGCRGETVRAGHGAAVVGQKGQGEWAVERVGHDDEGGGGGWELQDEQGGNSLLQVAS